MINVTNYIKFKSSVIIGLFLIFALQINIADAAKKKAKNKAQQHNPPVQTSLVVDVSNGKVLHSKNANVKIYPASLAKGMTLYLLFESINSGKISLNDYFHVSKAATKTLPSKLYLQEGEKIKVSDAVLALAVKSANDVAMVIAENLAGSEKKFINLMNKRAKQLGMNNTRFMNASGWHDPKQVSTANDIAKLYMALKRDFPKYYHFCSKTNFLFKNKKINGHNRVMANYPGAQAGKTGFTCPSGFNLVIEAKRNGKHLIAVVTGSPSWASRDKKMVNLLDQHFGVNQDTIKTAKSDKSNSKSKKLNKQNKQSTRIASKNK